MKKAVFLDRDGTIVEEVNYLSRVEDMALLPGAVEGLKALKEAGFLLIVVTNQAGVARGYFGVETVKLLNDELDSWLRKEGAGIDAFYYCPHHPDFSGPCKCRKPSAGMLTLAASEHGVDLSSSWMVGDKLSDLAAGRGAGCKTALVLTGYGEEELSVAAKKGVVPDIVVAGLAQFAETVTMRKNASKESTMALGKELLDMIICPRCKGELAYNAENNALDCAECGLRYPVEDGIPVLIADKAAPLAG